MLFTSEQVSCGHPDKICDQIADAVLTDCLNTDFKALVNPTVRFVLGGCFADTGVTGATAATHAISSTALEAVLRNDKYACICLTFCAFRVMNGIPKEKEA